MMPKKLRLYHTEIKTPPLSAAARTRTGQLLAKLLNGESLALPHSRPMPSIGARVHELRVNDQNQTWRLFYRVDEEAIVVVNLLSKKTEQTPLPTIRLCQSRFRQYDAEQKLQEQP